MAIAWWSDIEINIVADLPAKSLTDEAPVYDQPASEQLMWRKRLVN